VRVGEDGITRCILSLGIRVYYEFRVDCVNAALVLCEEYRWSIVNNRVLSE
jgi:hypothetical protein